MEAKAASAVAALRQLHGAADPRSTRQADLFLQGLQTSPDALQLGFAILQTRHEDASVGHFATRLLRHGLASRWDAVGEGERDAVRGALLRLLLAEAAPGGHRLVATGLAVALATYAIKAVPVLPPVPPPPNPPAALSPLHRRGRGRGCCLRPWRRWRRGAAARLRRRR